MTDGRPGDGGAGDHDVELVLPADTQHLRLARLVAAGVAAPAGLGVDDVDDLRIAVDELCVTLVQASAPGGRLTLAFSYADGEVRVQGRAPLDHPLDPADRRLGLSKEILAVVANEHDLSDRDGHLNFRLVKRRAEEPRDPAH